MKKKRAKTLSPEDALRFLEDFRTLKSRQDEKTHAISLRVPANLLRAFKTKARLENYPYQRLMIEALRRFILSEDEE